VKRRGPWCEAGSRIYTGKPFGREKLIEKAAAFQPFVFKVCADADRDHEKSLRQYAHVGPHGDNVICVAAAFLDLPREHRDALVAHEIGHLIAYPDGSEAAADAAFKVLTGVTIRYKDGPHGDCLQWLTPKDSKVLEGVFEFDLSGLKTARANPVVEGETEAGRRQRVWVEYYAITKAVENLVRFTHDPEWGDEIFLRLAHAMAAARSQASYRVGQKYVDKIWFEVLRKAQRVREKNRDLGERVERLLRLSQTPQGRSAIQAEIDAKQAAEEAAKAIPVEVPRSAALPIRGPSEDERRRIREEAIREIEDLMDPLMKAERQLEVALSRLKLGWPGYHKILDEAQSTMQDLRARYEAARERRDKASNPRRR
jgi:hypothetical protein